jgi:hypothetical protein
MGYDLPLDGFCAGLISEPDSKATFWSDFKIRVSNASTKGASCARHSAREYAVNTLDITLGADYAGEYAVNTLDITHGADYVSDNISAGGDSASGLDSAIQF